MSRVASITESPPPPGRVRGTHARIRKDLPDSPASRRPPSGGAAHGGPRGPVLTPRGKTPRHPPGTLRLSSSTTRASPPSAIDSPTGRRGRGAAHSSAAPGRRAGRCGGPSAEARRTPPTPRARTPRPRRLPAGPVDDLSGVQPGGAHLVPRASCISRAIRAPLAVDHRFARGVEFRGTCRVGLGRRGRRGCGAARRPRPGDALLGRGKRRRSDRGGSQRGTRRSHPPLASQPHASPRCSCAPAPPWRLWAKPIWMPITHWRARRPQPGASCCSGAPALPLDAASFTAYTPWSSSENSLAHRATKGQSPHRSSRPGPRTPSADCAQSWALRRANSFQATRSKRRAVSTGRRTLHSRCARGR
jgi:hypothetical protein